MAQESNSVDRVEKLLAVLILLQLKGSPDTVKAFYLNLAGMTNLEIADLLEINKQRVPDLVYKHKKAQKKP